MAEKKGFFAEFKAFITRGNVLDMAVGVIIGGAFSAIVTALTNQIIMPIINALLFLITGGKGLENIYTYIHKAMMVNEAGESVIDLANSIYIDWGAFITAIINFLLIALVLFLIVRTMNRIQESAKNAKTKYDPLTKEEIQTLRKDGKNWKEVKKAAAEKQARLDQEAAEAAATAPAPAPTTDELLIQIRDLLQAQAGTERIEHKE